MQARRLNGARFDVIEQPRFKHDCHRCRFVGHFGEADGYVCDDPQKITGSVVLRSGNDDANYGSIPLEIAKRPTAGPYFDVLKLDLTLQGKLTPEDWK